MKYKLELHYLDDAYHRREEWRMMTDKRFILQDTKAVADCIEPALKNAEERYGTSSEEARFIRELITALQ